VDHDGLDRLRQLGSPERLAEGWQTLRLELVDEPALSLSDYTDLLGTIILSRRAVEALGEFLHASGEILSVEIGRNASQRSAQDYSIFHVTRVSDALDVDQSSFDYFPDGTVRAITKYQFVPERLEPESFFRLGIKPRLRLYATEKVVRRARAAGLTGCEFLALT